MSTYLPPRRNPPEMMATVDIPLRTKGPMKVLEEAFLGLLPNIPLNMYVRYPNFQSFNMLLKIMVWNVQGAGNKLAALRELIRINDPTILALVETHLSGAQAQKVCDRIGFSGQTRVDAQGFSGGIWLFLREEQVTVTVSYDHTQHITIEVERRGEEPWMFSAIYASPDSTIGKELWRELENISQGYNGPWLLASDFNDTLSMSERIGVGGSEMQRRCREFSEWVDNNNLLDLGCSDPAHTWCRGLSAATFKSTKLDRGLANE